VPQQKPWPGDAEGLGRDDELRGLPAQRLAVHDPRNRHPRERADDEDERSDAGPEHGDHDEDEEERRDREHRVGEAHERPVDPAALEAGDRADEDADHDRREHRGEADKERHAAPVQEATQHVAPQLVGAKRMHRARTGEAMDRVGRLGRYGPEHRTHDREQRDDRENDERAEPEAIHARRSRGSIRVYARSTRIVASTAIPAMTTVRPVTSG